MAKLTIGDKTITIDDAFLSLSPEQQQQTVDEISANLGGEAQQPVTDASLSAQTSAQQQTFFAPKPQPVGSPDMAGSIAATMGGLVNGIPVLGPAVQKISDAMLAGGGMLADQLTGNQGPDLGGRMQALEERRRQLAQANPIASAAGNIGGAIGSVGAGGLSSAGSEALGLTGALVPRMANSLGSTLGLTTADNIVRGQKPTDALMNAAGPSLLAGVIPAAGDAAQGVGRVIGRKLEPIIGAITRPAEEALRRTGMAFQRDAKGGNVLSKADELIAAENGMDLVNAQRGGETTRSLSRSVANQSPEARSSLQAAADNTFTSQAPRAVDFIRRAAGGAVDDLGYQNTIKEAAAFVNAPKYRAAFTDPRAAAVWTPEIKQLMQSDAFRSAINGAESTGSNKAAISGFKAARNPFEFLPDGNVTLRTNADGSRALPSLQFWNQVKINLGDAEASALRTGNSALASDIGAIRKKLVASLDRQVPAYKQARATAASYFGAEDALDAGKMFANKTRQLPEAKAAFEAMKPAEQAAFRTGYASELIDKIKDGRFRSNVIDQAFGSPAKRELFEMVFGKAKAQQLEAYIRVEDLADKLRSALGNSTTARQLVELGIGTGVGAIGGFGLSGGNLGTAAQGAVLGAGVKGAQYLGKRADAQVMEEIGRLLTSGKRSDIDYAINQASLSPVWMKALERIGAVVGTAARGTAIDAGGNSAQVALPAPAMASY